MQYKEQIHNYVEIHREEIITTLKELIKIPSVRGEALTCAPFGKACADVLEYTQKLYSENGFETELNQNSGYLLSYYGEGEKTLGIFAHADVVPVSNDWIYTNPFEPMEKDGFLIGRGVLDDKSAVVASLYCAKMLKELNIPFNSTLVCFTGGNEESGMQDVKNYIKEHTIPDFSLVADTAFPIFRGNKGRITFSIKSKLPSGASISGGPGASVIGEAIAALPFDQTLFDKLLKHCNERISAEHDNSVITVRAKGIPKHSALPEGSLSAASLLTEALKETQETVFEDIYNMSACHYGEYFGIECNDSEFGKLTCVLTKLTTQSDGTVTADFNIRYGTSVSKDAIIKKITDKVKEINWSAPEVGGFSIPHSLPSDNTYVKKLLEVYSEFTNDKNSASYINAGGTYRQYLKNAAEIGITLIWGCPDGLPQGHGAVHQSDECININGFLQAIELTMHMLLECDKEI